MKRKWEIVHDCDGDNGEPTCWVLEVNHSDYGKYIWITDSGLGFDVEHKSKYSNDIAPLVTCKTLTSAKRWVSMNIR